MLTKNMEKALNAQINAEFYSSYLYLSMAAFFADINLPGFVTWMKCQAVEEQIHAMKFYNYITERNCRVLLKAIEMPPVQWKSPLAVFEDGLTHEIKVTGLINELVNLAVKEKDHATNNMLQWFVAEQVEEESSFNAVLQKLKMAGDNQSNLFLIDQELGARTFMLPAGTPFGGLLAATAA